MRYPVSLAMVLVLASGCMLVFDDGGGADDGVCNFAEPASAPAPQRNPETLSCQSFGGGECDPACGPCPAVVVAPQPSWGFCGSTCESLSEGDCAKAPECRVVKDAACAVLTYCLNDYIGCFPTDQHTVPTIDCFAAPNGLTCSLSAGCTAYHRGAGAALTPPALERTFAMCTPEGKSPGRCHEQVLCRAAAPACPANTRPGVENGCYTGACIPLDVCEPVPQQ